MASKPKIFISYKREEQQFAEEISSVLEEWGYDIWLDVREIEGGEYWPDEIDKGLQESSLVLGLMSPRAVGSRHVKNEWDWALEYRKLLLMIVQETEPIPHNYISIHRIDYSQDRNAGFTFLHKALSDAFGRPFEAIAKPAQTIIVLTDQERVNRKRTLEKVQKFWVEGVLLNILKEGKSFNIQWQITPDVLLKHREYGDYSLPEGAMVSHVFEDMRRELLILGEPGSGKTVLLLQLAQELLIKAKEDPTYPIPIILNLASWAIERKPFNRWVVDELLRQYAIPSSVAKNWVEAEKMLLLLDGLDEVNAEYRNDCVEMINDFRQHYDGTHMAICSRIAEYEALSDKLDLQVAITLLPLKEDQIKQFIASPELKQLQTIIEKYPVIRQLAETPFLLNTLAMIFWDEKSNPLEIEGNAPENLQHQILSRYVNLRLKQSTEGAEPYTRRETRHYLHWLGCKMYERKQTVFNIEGLQPDWLDTPFQKLRYKVVVKGSVALVCGIILGFGSGVFTYLTGQFAGTSNADSASVVNGICYGIGVALTVWLLFGLPYKLWGRGIIGVTIAGLYGPAVQLSDQVSDGLTFAMLSGGVGGLGAGMAIGLAVGFATKAYYDPEQINVVEVLSWSWRRLVWGTVIGIPVGIVLSIVSYLSLGGVGVVFGAIPALAIICLSGVTTNEVKMRIEPNQGIWRSLRYAWRTGFIYGGLFSVMIGAIVFVAESWQDGLFITFAMFLDFFLVCALLLGGLTCLRHGMIRQMLFRSGVMPLNYARFLDHAVQHGLLRRVGGGYIFVHRLLQEYFAKGIT